MLSGATHIAYPWYVLIGVDITMAVGILSSFTHANAPSVVPVRAETI